MKRTSTFSILMAAVVAMGMIASSCSTDDEVIDPSSRSLIEDPDSSLIFAPDSGPLDSLNEFTRLKVYIFDKDGNSVISKYIGEDPLEYNWYIEYKGGRLYSLCLGENYVPDFKQPDDFNGGAVNFYDSDKIMWAGLDGLQPEVGIKESAIFHWKDGTTDTVEFLALPNDKYPNSGPRYYMTYFLNGVQTAYPVVIVK